MGDSERNEMDFAWRSRTTTTSPTPPQLFLRSVLAAAALFASTPAHGYTQADSDAAAKWITEDLKFPMLNAFTRMTPKLVRVVMENYMNIVKPDTFEYLSASDVETIFTAVSAANNCELCLSFHAMALGGTGMDAADVDAISAGGLPADESAKKLVVAAKYALAHKGIILPREKLHLAELGFDEEMVRRRGLSFVVVTFDSVLTRRFALYRWLRSSMSSAR